MTDDYERVDNITICFQPHQPIAVAATILTVRSTKLEKQLRTDLDPPFHIEHHTKTFLRTHAPEKKTGPRR
jgi:hypothetical protein